jgi:16S rRNA (guanine527-N7)-methyltransferase
VPDADRGIPSPAALEQILGEARAAGFLGPGALATQYRHAEHFAVLGHRQPRSGSGTPHVVDLGSGGGLPGLVVALSWPEAHLFLVDANQRRTEFLKRAVGTLALSDRVTVINARAEAMGREATHRGRYDGVVARSFGPPATLAECAAPLLRVGGWVIVSEPPVGPEADAAAEGSRWPVAPLAQLGLVPDEFVQEEFGYQILRLTSPCPDRFPRRDGVPAKRPLF